MSFPAVKAATYATRTIRTDSRKKSNDEEPRARTAALPTPALGGYTFLCGRLVLRRDPRNNLEDRCAGGLFVCADCVEDLCKLMEEACNARAVDKEWEVDFDPLPE